MIEIKLLALDLDGTALRSNNTLSPRVKAAIERAAKSGIEVVVASGRPFASIPAEVLGIEGIRYVAASNGAAVYKNGTRVHSLPIAEEDIVKLLDLTVGYDLIWEAFQNGETCTDKRYYDNPVKYGCSEDYVNYVKSSRGFADDMRGYIFENRKNLDSVEFVCTDKDLRETLWRMAEQKIPSLYITSSSANFVEFMHKDATKSNAVKWICDALQINQKNTAAAGNADNDVDMISNAGLGVAVKNAGQACIANADLVVESNDNDGIAELIDTIFS